MDYTFSSLNDKEFEYLVCDLVTKVTNKRIERFKPGKDAGVDGRYFNIDRKEEILQCKHYYQSGLKKLLYDLEHKEALKVKKLKPAKYIFVTSVPLSRANKTKIKSIFAPYIKIESDIWGCEDLNDFLSEYKQIEEKHYKLWINSSTVLSRILKNAIKGRSEFIIENIKLNSNKYVYTENHYRALEHLKRNKVIIISGEPGIGKTTLANNLCLHYLAHDYEFIAIEEGVKEGEDLFDKDSKQIFYFDDFLGSNYFEAIENRKDTHIMNFIERINRAKNKIFILTSRTNIINKGLHVSPVFNDKKLNKNEFLMTMNDLSIMDKARILYNHIWFSNLGDDYIDEFYKDSNYMKVILHRNYNPRLIEFITDIDRIDTDLVNYWISIIDRLNNPADIWEKYLDVQSNIYIRSVVFLVVFNGGKIGEEDLKKAYKEYCSLKKIEESKTIDYRFDTIIKLSTKSMIVKNMSAGIIDYTVFNPSISDYILRNYVGEIDEIILIMQSLNTIKSLEQIYSIYKSELIKYEQYCTIIENVFGNYNTDFESNYTIYLCFIYYEINNDTEAVSNMIDAVLADCAGISEISKLLFLINEIFINLNNLTTNKLIEIISSGESISYKEINLITEIYLKLDQYDQDFIDFRKEIIGEYLSYEISDLENEIEIGNYIDFREDLNVDYTGIVNYFEEKLDESLFLVSNTEIGEIDIDLKELIESEIDIDGMVDSFLDNYRPDDDGDYKGVNYISDIHDLFSRS